MMDQFYKGFQDELVKLSAINPGTKAWAASRAITSGVAAGLMGGLTLSMAQRGTPKKKRKSAVAGAIPAAMLGTVVGLGKGIFEKGIERKVLKAITKIR